MMIVMMMKCHEVMGRKGEEIFMRIVDIHEGRERGCILDKQMGMADKAHVENEVVMFVHLFVYRHKKQSDKQMVLCLSD
ncbi:hypothetical protein EEL33_12200 [Muribaculaceae bacterium Isolate-037 (Harlan)]|jgi:hypothetical protein|nr:hypothetical protein EEL33_12200 [Muribaculaceae bacterium Isolate-037 (Harlan)]